MRLNELNPKGIEAARDIRNILGHDIPKSYHSKGFISYNSDEIMVANGWTELNSDGGYGVIYEKAGQQIVLKHVWSGDLAYLQFVKFVKKNRGNKHLPKIAGPFNIPDADDNGYFVLIEKLVPLPEDYEDHNEWIILFELLYALENSEYGNERDTSGIVVRPSDRLKRNIVTFGYENVKAVYDSNKGLFKTLAVLKKSIKGAFFSTDWHAKNFMIRPSTGDIVVIDPSFNPRQFSTFEGKDSLELDDIEVGDEIKVGRFLNSKATVKGFKKDKHNQPILKTTQGDKKLFKPRLSKLEEEMQYPGQSLAGFWKYGWYCLYDTQKAALAITEENEFEDVIIGGISVSQLTGEFNNIKQKAQTEYKVGSVAAEKGYGPILYYFGMTKGYLRSDLTVTTEAQKIWLTFYTMERQGKNIKKKLSSKDSLDIYGPVFKYAFTIAGPLRMKMLAIQRQAKLNHKQFIKWTSEFTGAYPVFYRPDEIETILIEGTQSYVNSKL